MKLFRLDGYYSVRFFIQSCLSLRAFRVLRGEIAFYMLKKIRISRITPIHHHAKWPWFSLRLLPDRHVCFG
jgi:hypothetical protein